MKLDCKQKSPAIFEEKSPAKSLPYVMSIIWYNDMDIEDETAKGVTADNLIVENIMLRV